jgi:hypothetical protein
MQAIMRQYLAAYLPKADKSITTVLELFKISAPDPPQGIPPDLMSFIFPVTEKLQSLKAKPTGDEIIETLYLQFPFRLAFARMLLPYLETRTFSLSERQYLAILAIQSCSCLLLLPLDPLTASDFGVFMDCLREAIPIFPDQISLFQTFTCLVYERIM